ncbi:hypothetical protein BLNAU_11096 [Blattamonas nauphoetae]|uniref:Uncharacterized protein n=1 Tax=Blattamonas nauphoetae TaxID=2049346 RepID=A0ABQ9XSA1_9EUKA|nr:hypothetical protein BLNAU_11096 [Blattamonas nauphoetae]
MTEPASPSPTTPLPCSPPSLPSKLTHQHLVTPSLSTALSSSAPAVGSCSFVHSTETPVSPAVLAIARLHQYMDSSRGYCGDDVASRDVGCVDVLSVRLQAVVLASVISVQWSQQQSRSSLECGWWWL